MKWGPLAALIVMLGAPALAQPIPTPAANPQRDADPQRDGEAEARPPAPDAAPSDTADAAEDAAKDAETTADTPPAHSERSLAAAATPPSDAPPIDPSQTDDAAERPEANPLRLAPSPGATAAISAAFAFFATETVVPRKKPDPPPQRVKPTLASVNPKETVASAGDGSCESAIASLGVSFTVLAPISQGACGAPRPLKVTKIRGITLQPAATMRCETARAAAEWVRDGLAPAAQRHFKTAPETIFVAASYSCRNRRNGRGPSSRLSEHALANALDVRSIAFANGESMSVAPKGPGRSATVAAFQAEIRAKGCDAFKTVLGPLSDPAHHDHLHFDLAQRRNGSKYCK
ncbi:extensin family protein [Acuticoccus sp. M5D2P5]|uniref:extensin-like domain-containing protein n=1 Tax=Acuticoccus kalidii TaxID=2910977 RepID=UPI001F22E07C|nr:extensin family protein [Acuticoccus kalidii]MCF3932519.1 extensin family protein [Acuticoccus kalidii]